MHCRVRGHERKGGGVITAPRIRTSAYTAHRLPGVAQPASARVALVLLPSARHERRSACRPADPEALLCTSRVLGICRSFSSGLPDRCSPRSLNASAEAVGGARSVEHSARDGAGAGPLGEVFGEIDFRIVAGLEKIHHRSILGRCGNNPDRAIRADEGHGIAVAAKEATKDLEVFRLLGIGRGDLAAHEFVDVQLHVSTPLNVRSNPFVQGESQACSTLQASAVAAHRSPDASGGVRQASPASSAVRCRPELQPAPGSGLLTRCERAAQVARVRRCFVISLACVPSYTRMAYTQVAQSKYLPTAATAANGE